MADDELDLSTLSDDDLVAQMHDDLYDGLKEEIEDAVRILLGRGWAPYDVLTKALVEGMRIVGVDFRDGILFVPEVLMSANAMKAGMAILRPLLAATGAPKMGKMVIGTVKGDIHDIGKNLVCMMMEGAGFEVFDIGINNGVEKYLEAIEKHQPEILGMSALLTTTMPYMKVVIDTLKEKGMRNDYIVLVGGAPLERILRASGRRRRLLPRRRRRRGDRQGAARAPAGLPAIAGARLSENGSLSPFWASACKNIGDSAASPPAPHPSLSPQAGRGARGAALLLSPLAGRGRVRGRGIGRKLLQEV